MLESARQLRYHAVEDCKTEKGMRWIQERAWELLKSELESLWSVRTGIGLKGEGGAGQQGESYRGDMAAPFSGLGTFVPVTHWMKEVQNSVLDTCKQREVEQTASDMTR